MGSHSALQCKLLHACCAAFEGAPEEYDITVHDTAGPESAAISKAAAELVAKVLWCFAENQHQHAPVSVNVVWSCAGGQWQSSASLT